MKIGINGIPLTKRLTGVGFYTYNLLLNLAKLFPETEYDLFLPRRSLVPLNLPNLKPIFCPFVKGIIWEQTRLSHECRRRGVDLLHCTNYIVPIISQTPIVLTIHDLAVLRYPQTHPWKRRFKHQLLLRRSIEKAKLIIAVSRFTAQEISSIFHFPGERVKVVYEGVSPFFFPWKDEDRLNQIRKRYNLPSKFILYVGTLEPRKNISSLLLAFEMLKSQRKFPHKLVITGDKGWIYGEIIKTWKRMEIKREVIFTGYIPIADLPGLYGLAQLFVYPSIYEGFGLPPLEAMACGTPVVVSNGSSLPEVVGEAGIIVDPKRPESICQGMERVLGNSSLQSQLRDKGLKRVKEFTWEKTAQMTQKIYEEVLSRG